MSDDPVAIRASGIRKVFRIYDRPGDRLKEAFSFGRSLHTDFVALDDISFEVRRGEFLGIVGRNGAGKSTLLRILSRELTPTAGTLSIRGKVSLLQLGVGFDPELTGMENARFASKLLGYSDAQVERMLEGIIEFADIGEFIRHPVKTYSSGMHSRLSFAVGINIDPDILIADEVLSVGDMRFSQKCLRRMREFKEAGKTVIFVSHDVQSINAFCDRALWILDGRVALQGKSRMVTTAYQNWMLYNRMPGEYLGQDDDQASDADTEGTGAAEANAADAGSPQQDQGAAPDARSGTAGAAADDQVRTDTAAAAAAAPRKAAGPVRRLPPEHAWRSLASLQSVGDGRARIERIALVDADSLEPLPTFSGNEEVLLLLDIQVHQDIEPVQIGWVIYNRQGLVALHTNNDICGLTLERLHGGQRLVAAFRVRLPGLANGGYVGSVGVQSGMEMPHKVDDAIELTIARADGKAVQRGYVIMEHESFEILPQASHVTA